MEDEARPGAFVAAETVPAEDADDWSKDAGDVMDEDRPTAAAEHPPPSPPQGMSRDNVVRAGIKDLNKLKPCLPSACVVDVESAPTSGGYGKRRKQHETDVDPAANSATSLEAELTEVPFVTLPPKPSRPPVSKNKGKGAAKEGSASVDGHGGRDVCSPEGALQDAMAAIEAASPAGDALIEYSMEELCHLLVRRTLAIARKISNQALSHCNWILKMLVSQQLEDKYFFSVVRLMIGRFRNMRRKLRIKVEKAGTWPISWTQMKKSG